jgi:hypothetical protein
MPAALDDADPHRTGEAAAEHALAALRRDRLVHSWHNTGTGFAIVVGRGTVGLSALDPPTVLLLAEQLRRDKVTIVGRPYPMGHRTTRYELSDGRFADRHDGRVGRYLDAYRYTVFLPGGHRSGCATEHFAAATFKEALALAGLVRIRGRCQSCQSARPLRARDWRPDPAIPCPGCGANATVPITVLCHRCHQPIVRNPTRATACSASPGITSPPAAPIATLPIVLN